MKHYHILKNSKYAIDGLFYAIKNETSFKIELFLGLIDLFFIFYLPNEIFFKILLFMSLMMIFICELINTAIEKTVDLHTKEYHALAKVAKDTASSAVMVAIFTHLMIWILI